MNARQKQTKSSSYRGEEWFTFDLYWSRLSPWTKKLKKITQKLEKTRLLSENTIAAWSNALLTVKNYCVSPRNIAFNPPYSLCAYFTFNLSFHAQRCLHSTKISSGLVHLWGFGQSASDVDISGKTLFGSRLSTASRISSIHSCSILPSAVCWSSRDCSTRWQANAAHTKKLMYYC